MITFKPLFIGLFFTLMPFTMMAQEVSPQDNTINGQFEQLFENSNSWEDYKVVKRANLTTLQKNTTDTINALEERIDKLMLTIGEHDSETAQLNNALTETQQKLDASIAEKDSVRLFGIPLSKGTYQTLMWSIIGLLALALVFFIYRYKNSNAQERDIKKRLAETETEYEEYRRKALEKEQKMGRLLQDERNKNARPGQ
ncbi:MAG: hypothetical protein WBG71_12175 [Leeuwenhoekiella sp.]